MMVEFCSVAISPMVWKSLSCKAVGLSKRSAACRRWEAWSSHSSAMILARLPLSAVSTVGVEASGYPAVCRERPLFRLRRLS
jgi:hypothetical protein